MVLNFMRLKLGVVQKRNNPVRESRAGALAWDIGPSCHLWSGSLCFRLQWLEAQLVGFLRLVSATILFIHNLGLPLAKIQSILTKLPIFPSFLHNGGTSKANLVSCTR